MSNKLQNINVIEKNMNFRLQLSVSILMWVNYVV